MRRRVRMLGAILAGLAQVGCMGSELVAPTRGERLQFHLLGNKTWTVYLKDGAIYSENGRKLPVQNVDKLVTAGRQYDQIDRLIKSGRIVVPAGPSESLSHTERLAVLKAMVEESHSKIDVSNEANKSTTVDDEDRCRPERDVLNEWSQKLFEDQTYLSELYWTFDQFCMPPWVDPNDPFPPPPPPPPDPFFCSNLGEQIQLAEILVMLDGIGRQEAYNRWWACVTFIAD